MEPVFIDFHIHTSNNPGNLNSGYDLDLLKTQIEVIADGSDYLISLTDHNTVNKPVYLKAVQEFKHLLLGVELHVRNYESAHPYHCHILFNLETIDAPVIDDINSKLDQLYPQKVVDGDDKSIPKLEGIMNCFDEYDFLILPHGGQNHSTFDGSIPDDVQFDRTLERSIYYNHFDGFTARSNTGLERTHRYFQRLGIKEFVNLVTTTDNYSPQEYPDCKAGKDAADFLPTWMLASPTFDGLRLSLSESSRLRYGDKPDSWSECIQRISLKDENIDIDVELTPGLNVVIGGSSSGKSLFVDSVYRQITSKLDDSIYLDTPYDIQKINVSNPAGQHPHYLDQNYISSICNPKDRENTIDDIPILKSVFPSDKEERGRIANGLSELASYLHSLVQSVKEIQNLQDALTKIPYLSHLIVTDAIQDNPLKYILPDEGIIKRIEYGEAKHERDVKALDEIDLFLSANPLVNHDHSLIEKLKAELEHSFNRSIIETSVRDIISNYEKIIDATQLEETREITTKRKRFQDLLAAIKKYITNEKIFNDSLAKISEFKIVFSTKEIESMGHKLYIDNEFELTKDKFLEVVNKLLKREHAIKTYDDIAPESLFEDKFKKQSPKVHDYDDFERKIKAKFEGMNKKRYRITTKEGRDFDHLSAGWKTSVILDLILGWQEDNAPLIIDQPEDNLATEYINLGLLEAIKKCKRDKQIILVSHNATIPMLGDAQNVVLCTNDNNHITIRSNPLEGSIDGISVVDLIAKITDGGKSSVKKRVKKYNLKNFRGDHEVSV